MRCLTTDLIGGEKIMSLACLFSLVTLAFRLSALLVWCLEARQGSKAGDRGAPTAVFAGLRCSQGRLLGGERSVGARAEGAYVMMGATVLSQCLTVPTTLPPIPPLGSCKRISDRGLSTRGALASGNHPRSLCSMLPSGH